MLGDNVAKHKKNYEAKSRTHDNIIQNKFRIYCPNKRTFTSLMRRYHGDNERILYTMFKNVT